MYYNIRQHLQPPHIVRPSSYRPHTILHLPRTHQQTDIQRPTSTNPVSTRDDTLILPDYPSTVNTYTHSDMPHFSDMCDCHISSCLGGRSLLVLCGYTRRAEPIWGERQ
jgi:hypothetical protein